MADGIVRALAYDGQVRVSAVVDTVLVEELRKRHDTFPVATAALGRTVSAALLLSWGLKGEGMLTLRVLGDGPLGGIVVTADANGQAKGYVQEPQVEIPLNEKGKLDVGGAVGKGFLYVTKDIGLKEPYTGSVPLVSGEIGDDVAEYLMQSEQTPSLVAVGVLVDPDYSVAASGGVIIQTMPGAEDNVLDEVAAGLLTVQPVSALVKKGYGARELIRHYLPFTEVDILEESPVQFHCNCSRERVEGLLRGMGKEELEDILEKEEEPEVVCHFCNEHYKFARDEIAQMLKEAEEK